MSNEKISAYQEALRAYTTSTSRIETAVENVEAAARMMAGGEWRSRMFSGTSVGFPAEVALNKKPSIDVTAWPDIRALAQQIAEWHDLRHRVQEAWRAIPQSDRIGLAEPER